MEKFSLSGWGGEPLPDEKRAMYERILRHMGNKTMTAREAAEGLPRDRGNPEDIVRSALFAMADRGLVHQEQFGNDYRYTAMSESDLEKAREARANLIYRALLQCLPAGVNEITNTAQRAGWNGSKPDAESVLAELTAEGIVCEVGAPTELDREAAARARGEDALRAYKHDRDYGPARAGHQPMTWRFTADGRERLKERLNPGFVQRVMAMVTGK